MKLKKYISVALCAILLSVMNVQATDIKVKINGNESIVIPAQPITNGLKAGENFLTVTHTETMKEEETCITTIAALYCNGALEDVAFDNSTPVGVGGQIPHSDFSLILPEGCIDYFVKVFFLKDYSKLLPLENKGKETSGTALAGNDILVDGNIIPVNTQKQEFDNPSWIHIEDNNGYVFLETGNVSVTREHNNGKSFAVITQQHGENPQDAGYSYVVLPKADAEKTEKYSQRPDVEIICANETVHAIRDLLTDTYYVNVYEGSYTINGITLPMCSAIIKENSEKIEFALSDPTQTQKKLELKLSGKTVTTVGGADKEYVRVSGSTVDIDISERRGGSYSFTLAVQ